MISKTIKNKLLTYILTAISGSVYNSYALYGPNEEAPDVETLLNPVILIDIDDVGNSQFALGSRATRKNGFITVTLLVKEGSGINTISEFKEFMDGLGLARSNNVTYKEPVVIPTPAKYKGWEPTSVALPYQLENYV